MLLTVRVCLATTPSTVRLGFLACLTHLIVVMEGLHELNDAHDFGVLDNLSHGEDGVFAVVVDRHISRPFLDLFADNLSQVDDNDRVRRAVTEGCHDDF